MLCELKDFCSFSECSQLQRFQKLNMPCRKRLNCSCLRVELVRESSGHETFFHYIWDNSVLSVSQIPYGPPMQEKRSTQMWSSWHDCVKNMNQLHWVGQKVPLKVSSAGANKEVPYIFWSGNGALRQEPKEENRKRVSLYHCPRCGILVFNSPHWISFYPQKFVQFLEAGCILASTFSKNVDAKIP